jgi:hypothetical protein
MMTVNREKTLPTALRIVRENGGAIRVPRTARSRGARPRGYFFAELPASTADPAMFECVRATFPSMPFCSPSIPDFWFAGFLDFWRQPQWF